MGRKARQGTSPCRAWVSRRRETMVQEQAAPAATGYANPDVLVETAWVAAHLDDPRVRLVESDEDVLLYELGHLPGAVKLDWQTEQQSQLIRDFVTAAE